MTRQEYLNELDEHLISLSDMERELAVNFYIEYFDEAGEENEQAVMDELGKPFQLAKSIISEQSAYSKSEVYAKFKESNSIDDKGTGVYASIKKESTPYTPPTYSDSISQNMQRDNEPDVMPNQNVYTSNEADSGKYQPTNEAYGGNTSQTNNDYDYSYNNNNSDSPFTNETTYNYQTKKRMSTGAIIFWILFIIFIGVPIILPLAACLFVAFIMIILVAGMGLVCGAAAVVAGIICAIFGVVRMFTLNFGKGLAGLGVGALSAGIGLLVFVPCLLFCVKTIPWVFKGIAKLCTKIARRAVDA